MKAFENGWRKKYDNIYVQTDHALPTLEWYQTQSMENSLSNASWVEAGKTQKPLLEETTKAAAHQVRL